MANVAVKLLPDLGSEGPNCSFLAVCIIFHSTRTQLVPKYGQVWSL
jgi:hypothetical protein